MNTKGFFSIYVKPFGIDDGKEQSYPIDLGNRNAESVYIENVRLIISKGLKIPPDRLLLYFNGQELNDASSLKQCDVTDGSTLQLIRLQDQLEYIKYTVKQQQKERKRINTQKQYEQYNKTLLNNHRAGIQIKHKYEKITGCKCIKGGIKELFDHFNNLFFIDCYLSMSSHIDIKWYNKKNHGKIVASDMDECAGVFQAFPSNYFNKGGIIYLSPSILGHRSICPNDIFSQLLHEMIHAYLYVNTLYDETGTDHGASWLGIAWRINIITGLNIAPYHNLYDAVVDAKSQRTKSVEGHDMSADNEYFRMLLFAVKINDDAKSQPPEPEVGYDDESD